LGVLFLLGQYFNFTGWHFLWPFVMTGFGGVFFLGMLAGGKPAAGLAIPGSIISGIGLILSVQNFTGHWASWAYGWTLILMLVGLGIWIMGLWGGTERHRRAGLQVMKIGFVFFIIFGALFEFVFFGFGGPTSQIVFPILLILVGVYLIARRIFWPGSNTIIHNDLPLNAVATPPSEQPTQRE
jgi:hypothetical protein